MDVKLDPDKCYGQHELYVAECVAVESEGKLIVVTVCRHCDRVSFHEHHATLKPHVAMTFLKEKIKE